MNGLDHIALLSQDFEQLVRRREDCWKALDGASLLITGGSGFFGTWLAHSFYAAMQASSYRFDVHIACREPGRFLDNYPYFQKQRNFHFHAIDVLKPLTLQQKFDHIIHAATSASAKLNAEQPLTMIDTIVQGTRNVLDFAAAQGIRSVSFTSSGAVYGSIPYGQLISESAQSGPDLQNPRSAYGEAKRLAELMCAIYAAKHGMSIPILRCFAFVGPFMSFDSHFAMGNFIQDAIQGRAPFIKGDHRTVRSYLYGADLVDAILLTLCRSRSPGLVDVINVGSDLPLTIADLAEAIRDCFQVKDPVGYAENRVLNQTVDWYVPSVDKLKQSYEFQESQSMISSIQKTGDWLKSVRRFQGVKI